MNIISFYLKGTRTKDSIVIRVFNKDFKMPTAKMHALLKKANLEAHGYKLEVTNRLTRQPSSNKAEYTKTYYYYKTVSCDKAYEVEQELDRLLRGMISDNLQSAFISIDVSVFVSYAKSCLSLFHGYCILSS